MSNINLYQLLGGENSVNALTENFYEKLLDDYRVRRFFNDSGKKEQIATFKAVINAALEGNLNNTDFIKLVSNFFMAAFARFKDKELLPESGFAYFGMIIGQNNPSTKYLCDSHSHLLKFMPDDSHYDAVIENLTATLQESNVDNSLATDLVALAERARNHVLGR